jgi:hypothetical protein
MGLAEQKRGLLDSRANWIRRGTDYLRVSTASIEMFLQADSSTQFPNLDALKSAKSSLRLSDMPFVYRVPLQEYVNRLELLKNRIHVQTPDQFQEWKKDALKVVELEKHPGLHSNPFRNIISGFTGQPTEIKELSNLLLATAERTEKTISAVSLKDFRRSVAFFRSTGALTARDLVATVATFVLPPYVRDVLGLPDTFLANAFSTFFSSGVIANTVTTGLDMVRGLNLGNIKEPLSWKDSFRRYAIMYSFRTVRLGSMAVAANVVGKHLLGILSDERKKIDAEISERKRP